MPIIYGEADGTGASLAKRRTMIIPSIIAPSEYPADLGGYGEGPGVAEMTFDGTEMTFGGTEMTFNA